MLIYSTKFDTVIVSYITFCISLIIGLVSGTATVIDGDTIEIRGQRIRLHGIDAPESSQWCTDNQGNTLRCGQQAALQLDSLVGGKNCQCQILDTDRYGRQIAICYRDGTDINEWMVAHGQALAYRKYSSDYVEAEQSARSVRRGIWQYSFEEPWSWRQQRRGANGGEQAAQQMKVNEPSGDCHIKGNISRDGERIYHTTDSPWYERTRIDVSAGERWFCSEQQAKQAGWRCVKY